MSNDVAKFGVSLDFTKAMSDLRRLRSEITNLNNMQRNLNSSRRSLSGSRNSFTDRRDREAEYAREVQHQRDMALARRNPTGAGNSRQSDERRRQEALGRSMANDITTANRLRERGARRNAEAERAHFRALERARSAIRNSTLMQEQGANAAQRSAQANIRARIAAARTAEEVRSIVAQERARLRLMQRQGSVARRMQQSSRQMMTNYVSAFAVAAVGVGITKTGQEFERAANTLTAITGSAQKAASEMQYLKDITYQMGIPLKETAKDYAKLTASATGFLSEGQIKNLFEDLTKAAVVLGTTSEDQGLVFKALTQMLSKQKVSAEEYRGQLGERMPIALQAMSKAAVKAGIVTDDMIKKFGSATGAIEDLMVNGKLYSKDILPFFGAEISKIVDPGFEKALKSNINAMGRLQNVLESTGNEIFKAGWGEGLTDIFNSLGALLKDNEMLFKAFGNIVGKIFSGIAWTIDSVVNPTLSAFGSILNTVAEGLDKFGWWASVAFLPLLKLTPVVNLLTAAIVGTNTAMLPLLLRTSLWGLALIAIVGSLEEIAELLSPTGKDTILSGLIESLEVPPWVRDLLDLDGAKVIINEVEGKKADIRSNFWNNPFGSGPAGLPSKDAVNVNVESKLYIDGEEAATTLMKTNAADQAISSKYNDWSGYNY